MTKATAVKHLKESIELYDREVDKAILEELLETGKLPKVILVKHGDGKSTD